MSYGTIVVCGGGCYGGYYVRQLARARTSGALAVDRIVVVDRDPHCRVARLADAIARGDVPGTIQHGWRMQRADDSAAGTPSIEPGYADLPIAFVRSDWESFFRQLFADAIDAPESASVDAVVPSPLMPNLLADWIMSRVALHRPRARTTRSQVGAAPDTPWKRESTDGESLYVSFATWMCPINCIEPPRCPETRGPRDWTMPAAVLAAVKKSADDGRSYDVVSIFRTTHRLFGVGMFDVSDAIEADRSIRAVAAKPELTMLVASVSHCHGALAEIRSVDGPLAAGERESYSAAGSRVRLRQLQLP